MTTKAKLAGTKLDWIDETTADSMFHRLDSHHLAIVEVKVDTRTEKSGDDDDRTVVLKVTNVTLATEALEDHLRDIQRAEYLRRKDGQLALTEADEDTTDAIIERGRNVLLTCQTCLHPRADEDIVHWKGDPDADGAVCTWLDLDVEVKPGEDRPGPIEGEPPFDAELALAHEAAELDPTILNDAVDGASIDDDPNTTLIDPFTVA